MKPVPKRLLGSGLSWRLAGFLALAAWWLLGCGSKPPPPPPPKPAAPPKATIFVAPDTNLFRGHFTDGRTNSGRDPFNRRALGIVPDGPPPTIKRD